MKRRFIPIFVILITIVFLMNTGLECRKKTSQETTAEETVIAEEEIVEEEEEVIVEEEVIEEEDIEEEVIEEEQEVPPPEPAKLVFTNLRITSEEGETDYTVTVDITNTGGERGSYQGRAKVDDEDMDLINVELDPGEKKTLTLTTAQNRISSLAKQYKSGWTDQRTCDLSIGSLSHTITFPTPKYMLKLMYSRAWITWSGELSVFGGVKNIGDENLNDVEVVVEFHDADGKLLETVNKLVNKNPLEPDQTASFEIASVSPARRYYVYFRFKDGDTILTDYSETDWRDE